MVFQEGLLFQPVDQVRICLSDSLDRMNSGQDQRRQRVLVRHFHDREEVRLTPAWIDCLDLFDFGQGINDVQRLARQDIDEHVRAIRHSFPLRFGPYGPSAKHGEKP